MDIRDLRIGDIVKVNKPGYMHDGLIGEVILLVKGMHNTDDDSCMVYDPHTTLTANCHPKYLEQSDISEIQSVICWRFDTISNQKKWLKQNIKSIKKVFPEERYIVKSDMMEKTISIYRR